jgi:urease accessory protein
MIGAAPQLLKLLHLASPALPVGAFSYSEGLETLVQQGKIMGAEELSNWLIQELQYGAMRLEAIALGQSYRCMAAQDEAGLSHWNHWLSALREAEELRQQSWQMGRSLVRLLLALEPELTEALTACGEPCNFAVAFAIAAAHWQIDLRSTTLGYLHSWSSNLINAGVKLIPLGQTQGQQILLQLYPTLEQTTESIMQTTEEELYSCGWGLAIASLSHETLYSRLFRS